MNDTKFDKIYMNKINGNISDYKNLIRGLSKIELVSFIGYLNVKLKDGYELIKWINKIITIVK